MLAWSLSRGGATSEQDTGVDVTAATETGNGHYWTAQPSARLRERHQRSVTRLRPDTKIFFFGVWKEMRSTNVGLTEGRTMYRNTDSPFPPYYISPPNITLTRARAIISLSLCARCLSAPLTQVFNTRKPQPAPMPGTSRHP